MTAIEGHVVSVEIIRSRQNNKGMAEPLLHFPFIHSLVNPCDLQTDVVDSEEQNVSPAYLRDSSRNGEIPFSQQVLDFLNPFRHFIDVQSTEPNSSNNGKMKVQLTQEFKLVVSQTLLLIHRIYSPSVSSVLFLNSFLKMVTMLNIEINRRCVNVKATS
jgi:hypothetical protein